MSSTRRAYDATAQLYTGFVGTSISAGIEGPIDRALLSAFVEVVRGGPAPRQVVDVGCGPGRVAAFLAQRGLEVVGVDVSAQLLAAARLAHPKIEFREGILTALPLADGSQDGAVCWYSTIHTPPALLGDVWAELVRVLAPGGHLLVGFQAGDGERVHRAEVGGIEVDLSSYRHDPDEMGRGMAACGLHVQARAVREAQLPHEVTPQAFLLARRR